MGNVDSLAVSQSILYMSDMSIYHPADLDVYVGGRRLARRSLVPAGLPRGSAAVAAGRVSSWGSAGCCGAVLVMECRLRSASARSTCCSQPAIRCCRSRPPPAVRASLPAGEISQVSWTDTGVGTGTAGCPRQPAGRRDKSGQLDRHRCGNWNRRLSAPACRQER